MQWARKDLELTVTLKLENPTSIINEVLSLFYICMILEINLWNQLALSLPG